MRLLNYLNRMPLGHLQRVCDLILFNVHSCMWYFRMSPPPFQSYLCPLTLRIVSATRYHFDDMQATVGRRRMAQLLYNRSPSERSAESVPLFCSSMRHKRWKCGCLLFKRAVRSHRENSGYGWFVSNTR